MIVLQILVNLAALFLLGVAVRIVFREAGAGLRRAGATFNYADAIADDPWAETHYPLFTESGLQFLTDQQIDEYFDRLADELCTEGECHHNVLHDRNGYPSHLGY